GLDRVGVVVLGGAEHHEIARQGPVGLSELPKRAADRVYPRCRHIDRAEAAVRGIVGRTELACPPSCERLALVASGKERQPARVGAPDLSQPVGCELKRFLPLDLAKFG